MWVDVGDVGDVGASSAREPRLGGKSRPSPAPSPLISAPRPPPSLINFIDLIND